MKGSYKKKAHTHQQDNFLRNEKNWRYSNEEDP